MPLSAGDSARTCAMGLTQNTTCRTSDPAARSYKSQRVKEKKTNRYFSPSYTPAERRKLDGPNSTPRTLAATRSERQTRSPVAPFLLVPTVAMKQAKLSKALPSQYVGRLTGLLGLGASDRYHPNTYIAAPRLTVLGADDVARWVRSRAAGLAGARPAVNFTTSWAESRDSLAKNRPQTATATHRPTKARWGAVAICFPGGSADG